MTVKRESVLQNVLHEVFGDTLSLAFLYRTTPRLLIRAKRNYGGIYKVLGCGVEVDAYVPIRINKNDASVTFIYN